MFLEGLLTPCGRLTILTALSSRCQCESQSKILSLENKAPLKLLILLLRKSVFTVKNQMSKFPHCLCHLELQGASWNEY